jgi:hypothetical protein
LTWILLLPLSLLIGWEALSLIPPPPSLLLIGWEALSWIPSLPSPLIG